MAVPSASARDARQDGRDDDCPMSIATSRISILDDQYRPSSLSPTASNTPQITAAARDRQRSLATQILGPNHHLVFPLPESSQASSQDLSRSSGDPEFPEYSVRSPTDVSTKPLPSHPAAPAAPLARSPSPSTHFENLSIEKGISSPVAISDSLGFALKGLQRTPSSSMNRSKSHRVSMFTEDLKSMGDSEIPVASGEISKNAVTTTDWPPRTPTASPTPKTPFDGSSAVSPSETSSTVTEPPQQSVSLTQVISPQAGKDPRMNFLPKFLRAKTSTAGKGESGVDSERKRGTLESQRIVETEGTSPQDEGVSPKSFFDDDSSEGGDESHIESAQQAIIASPVVVRQGSATKVALKEMLGSTPPAEDRGKSIKMLGEEFRENDVRRESATNNYEHQVAGAAKGGPLGMGLWKDIDPFTSGAQRSDHSSQHLTPSPTPPPKPKATRKVSFPRVEPLDIKSEHRFLRQSIVSTPYPSEGDEGQAKRRISGLRTLAESKSERDVGSESVLTLLISGHNTSAPKFKRVVLPNSQQVSLMDDSEKKRHPTRATIMAILDDEQLFRLVRREYVRMRGTLNQLASVRTVRSMNLLSYKSASQLVSKHVEPPKIHIDEEGGDDINARMLSLFRNPKEGAKHDKWIRLIQSYTETGKEASGPETKQIAFELVEGWSPLRIYFAIAAVFISSLAATLLWIFVGAGGENLALQDAFGALARPSEGEIRYRGAAGRVESGAILGLLVLFLGWTGVGGWVLVSWLVT